MARMETERRYIVKTTRMIQGLIGRRIVQGYLGWNPVDATRVRITDDSSATLMRTIGRGLEREQTKEIISLRAAKFLLDGSSHWLEKSRFDIPCSLNNGLEWRVDVYDEPLHGLVIAEIRFDEPGREIQIPSWLEGAIEVTEWIDNFVIAEHATDLRLRDREKTIVDMLSEPLPRIVFTGSPCSGKTSTLRFLQKEFKDDLHCVPEIASLVNTHAGIQCDVSGLDAVRQERHFAQARRILEALAELQAKRDGKKAIVVDRGVMDSAAYLLGGTEEFIRTIQSCMKYEFGRYDLILRFETPPLDVYLENRGNNDARTEEYKRAVLLGQRIEEIWGVHPNVHFVGNAGSWLEKLNRAHQIIKDFLASL